MRGTSLRNETATAVTQKTNFGTLRNQDRQNDMQRFLKDLLKIKAEIICEHFSPEFLMSFLHSDERKDMNMVVAAVRLLKHDKLRQMVIDLETDGCYNQDKAVSRILETLNNINVMIARSFEIVSKQPALLPLYRQMIESAVATMPALPRYATENCNSWSRKSSTSRNSCASGVRQSSTVIPPRRPMSVGPCCIRPWAAIPS